MSTSARTHAVVVPTLGVRHAPLLGLLHDLARQLIRPHEIFLVAPSDNVSALRSLVGHLDLEGRIWVIPGRRGTASQRNAGMDRATADLVHFLDDDVRIGPHYLLAMDRAFDDPETVGATGNFVDLIPRTSAGVRRILRRIALAEPGQGCVGRAGVNQPVRDRGEDRWVDWMSGGALTVRRSVTQDLRFDERLQEGPTGAYALGEDVHFSHRMASLGRLLFVSQAHVRHPAPSSEELRCEDPLYYEMRALSRRYLVAKDEQRLSVSALRWSQALELAWLAYRFALGQVPGDCVVAFARGAWCHHALLVAKDCPSSLRDSVALSA